MNSSQASQNCGTVAVTDIPLAGDMYGGRSAEVMVYRKSAPAAFHVTRTGAKERVIKLGRGADQPVLGDWDGDGRVNPGVREPASRLFTMQVKRSKTTVKFGKSGDLPIAGNWDGERDLGDRRPPPGQRQVPAPRCPTAPSRRWPSATPNDLPVTGDWDGNGVTDLGVYDQATATFTLLQKDPMGMAFTTAIPFGIPGDVPVTGDWDGNGITDLGVWNPATATFNKRGAVAPTGVTGRVKKVRFGRPRPLTRLSALSSGRSKTRQVLVAVATGVPDSSVTTPSLKPTREPRLDQRAGRGEQAAAPRSPRLQVAHLDLDRGVALPARQGAVHRAGGHRVRAACRPGRRGPRRSGCTPTRRAGR